MNKPIFLFKFLKFISIFFLAFLLYFLLSLFRGGSSKTEVSEFDKNYECLYSHREPKLIVTSNFDNVVVPKIINVVNDAEKLIIIDIVGLESSKYFKKLCGALLKKQRENPFLDVFLVLSESGLISGDLKESMLAAGIHLILLDSIYSPSVFAPLLHSISKDLSFFGVDTAFLKGFRVERNRNIVAVDGEKECRAIFLSGSEPFDSVSYSFELQGQPALALLQSELFRLREHYVQLAESEGELKSIKDDRTSLEVIAAEFCEKKYVHDKKEYSRSLLLTKGNIDKFIEERMQSLPEGSLVSFVMPRIGSERFQSLVRNILAKGSKVRILIAKEQSSPSNLTLLNAYKINNFSKENIEIVWLEGQKVSAALLNVLSPDPNACMTVVFNNPLAAGVDDDALLLGCVVFSKSFAKHYDAYVELLSASNATQSIYSVPLTEYKLNLAQQLALEYLSFLF